jgi:hypothetical protein
MAGFGRMKQETNNLAKVRVARYCLYLCTMQFDEVIATAKEVLDSGTIVDKPLAAAFYAVVGQAHVIAGGPGHGLSFITIAKSFHPFDEFQQLENFAKEFSKPRWFDVYTAQRIVVSS